MESEYAQEFQACRAEYERARQGWRVRPSPGGEAIAAATEDGMFLPMARVCDGQLSFICRNDAVPSQGTVIGLAAPSVQKDLDRALEQAE